MPVPVPNLEYVSDEDPGITRRRAGRGFVYRDPRGVRLAEPSTLERVRAIAVPPAWTDVWIAPTADGHIQATGRDARGRKQYRYHPAWREFRDQVKFEHLRSFGAVLPSIRRQVASDLASDGVSRDRVIATVVRLLELSLIRVGNEEYARANGSYGLTTLRARHLHVEGSQLEFVFRGKSGKEHRARVSDRRVARAVRLLQDLPGQRLFQYLDDEGGLCPVGSADVNAYMRGAAGADVTAKEYRTWMGTVLAASRLAALPAPQSAAEARDGLKSVIGTVSRDLGNTPAVCRASYVHPRVITAFEEGSLNEQWASLSRRGSRQLGADERRLLAFLRVRRTRANVSARAA